MRMLKGILLMLIGATLFAVSGFMIIGFTLIDKDTNFALFSLTVFILSIFILMKSITLCSKEPKEAEPFVNPYVDCSLYDTGILPHVNYSNILLKPNEVLYYACPSKTFILKEEIVGYSGGNDGVSIRISKGMTYHTSASKRTAIRKDVVKYNDGDFIVTNQRIIFIGIKDSFETPLNKITGIKLLYQDAFIILMGNKHKNIWLEINQMPYALKMTYQVLQLSGVDIPDQTLN